MAYRTTVVIPAEAVGLKSKVTLFWFFKTETPMKIAIDSISSALVRWQNISDAYAQTLIALQNGKPEARRELDGLRLRLEECRKVVDCLIPS